MKAVVNGITLEGTPEEIMEYQLLQEEKMKKELMSKLAMNHSHSVWGVKEMKLKISSNRR